MPDWIARGLAEFPVVLLLVGVVWLTVKYTREQHEREAARLNDLYDRHLRSKDEEVRRLTEQNERLQRMVEKLLADHQKERDRLTKRLSGPKGGER